MIVDNNTLSQFEVNFKLNLDVGSHTLQVTTHDLVGNIKQTEKIDIRYTGESQLIDYGTYPNPFTTKTTFIYELTEQFDDVIIKIFTISGQKIFTMSVSENAITDLPLYSIGYHEIPWYGHDEFGNTVANGVYFYIIEGQVNDKKIKSTGKIAKLR
jgi:flagellar hook assembly protein FlgD